MTKPAHPSNPKTAGDDRNLVPVDENYKALTFEDTVNQIWTRNRNMVYGLIALVLFAILAKGGWEYFQRQQELKVEQAYTAATTPEQMKTFAAAHADHSLAAITHLRMADDAYAAGKALDAIASYDRAIAILKSGPLAARAQLGRALAKILAVKPTEATAELKQLANDAGQLNAVRAEAAYHLASLASETGNAADVQQYADQVMKIDPASPWAQRAMMLRAMMPATAAAVTAPSGAPTPAQPAAAPKKDDDSSSMKITLPGK